MENPKLQTIGPYAFYMCSLLQSIDLSCCTHLETISEYAFSGCSGVLEVHFPNTSLKTFKDYAFQGINAKSITIPASLKSLSSSFYQSNIEEVIFEEGCQVTSFKWGAFSYTSIENFTVPPSVTSIFGNAFEGTKMRNITVDTRNNNFVIHGNGLYNTACTTFIYYPKLCSEN